MIGELTLDGRLRCVPGVLPMTMAAAARGLRDRLRARAADGRGRDGAGRAGSSGSARSAQVMALLNGEAEIPEAPEVEPMSGLRRC